MGADVGVLLPAGEPRATEHPPAGSPERREADHASRVGGEDAERPTPPCDRRVGAVEVGPPLVLGCREPRHRSLVSVRRGGTPLDGGDPHGVRDALQRHRMLVHDRERYRIVLDRRARHEDLVASGERADAGGLVHPDARVVRPDRPSPRPRAGRSAPGGRTRGDVDARPTAAGSPPRTSMPRTRRRTPRSSHRRSCDTSSPRWVRISDSSVSLCQRTTSSHASSPIVSSRFVDPTMSVNMNVRPTRRPAVGDRRLDRLEASLRLEASRRAARRSRAPPAAPAAAEASSPSERCAAASRMRACAVSNGRSASVQCLIDARSSAIALLGLALVGEDRPHRLVRGRAP